METSVHLCVCVFSRVWLSADLWTVACQVPQSMGFSRQKYWTSISSSRGASWPKDRTCSGLSHCIQIVYHLSHQGSPGVTCYFYRGCFISDADKKVKCYLLLLHLKLSVVVVCRPRHVAHEILVHWPGVEPMLSELGTQRLNHCTTREVPDLFSTWWYDAMQCLP